MKQHITIIMVALLLLTGCGNGEDKLTGDGVKEKTAETIRIGAILPLSGDAAAYGQPAQKVVDLAVEEINKAGGINGKDLKVIYEDGTCSAKGGSTAAQKLINVDGVKVILGGFCSGETLGAAPVAEETKVILFSPGSGSPDITQAGEYIFRNFPSDATSGSKVAMEALARGDKKIAIIAEQTDYSQAVKEVFKKAFTTSGGTITAEESFASDSTDFQTPIAKMKASNPDALYIIAQTPAKYGLVLKQTKAAGMEQQIYTNEFANTKEILTGYGKEIEGAIYAEPRFDENAPRAADLLSKIQTKYGAIDGGLPPVYFATTYDGVHILKESLEKCGEDTSCIKDALYQVKDREGTAGKLTIDLNGDAQFEYTLKQIKDGKPTDVDTSRPEQKTPRGEPIKIGFLGALTGDAATYGTDDRDAVELAVADINAAGGINGRPLSVEYEDTKCSTKDAVTSATKMVETDGVKAILGPSCSGEALAVAPVTEKGKILMFMTMPSNQKIRSAGDFVFRNMPGDDLTTAKLAEFVAGKYKRIAIISENTDYAQGAREGFRLKAKEAGISIVADETYEASETDYRSQLLKIQAANPDAIFINPQGDATGGRILKQLKEAGIKAQPLFIWFGSSEVLQEAAGAGNAEGLIWIDLPQLNNGDSSAAQLLKKHENKYGKAPTFPFFFALAYDRTMLIGDMMKGCGEDTACLRDGLYHMQPYHGVSGTFSFDKDGEVLGLSHEAFQLKDGDAVRLG